MNAPWPLHTLVLAVGCALFLLGLLDRHAGTMIAGAVIAAVELLVLHLTH